MTGGEQVASGGETSTRGFLAVLLVITRLSVSRATELILGLALVLDILSEQETLSFYHWRSLKETEI
ncbi:hypothetical protein RRG08_012717 [Elysia crispata]|uniref:Uncharacterized protein n=1 Tax=Elysia crispata TaxID=231223 RepID=A0AAE1E8V3_9GAST|nr:hypothetical protein RRG08_012717 [Elysia crispata]